MSSFVSVFRNGDEFFKPVIVFLKPLEQSSLPRVWASVAEKVQLKNTRPIRRCDYTVLML